MSVIDAQALFHARSHQVRTSAESAKGADTPFHIKTFIDALPHPIAVFSTAARSLYLNSRLRTLLQHEPNADELTSALREVSHETACAKDEVTADVRTVGGSYRASTQFLDMPLLGAGETVVINVEPVADVFPSENDLREEFALTDQEARVTMLLAQRLTTAEIADGLGISKNTVRRHIERVLAKLQLNNRADVRDRIMSGYRSI